MHLQQPGQACLQHLSLCDLIHKAMLQQEFRLLKSFRKLPADRLLNYPGTCKADQRSRLRQNDISQRSEACCHTAGRRIGQHADREQPRITVALHRRCCLRHLHQRQDAFLHPSSARTASQNNRKTFFGRPLHCAGDPLSHHRSHASHEKPGIADPKNRRITSDLRRADQYSF